MKNIVFVHGFMGSARNWLPTVHRLKKEIGSKTQVNIVCIDLLFHGEKRNAKKVSSALEDLFKNFNNEMLKLTGKISIVAHSFGAQPSIHFTAQNIDRVDELILEDTSPVVSDYGLHSITKILQETPESFENRLDAKRYFQKKYAPAFASFLLSNMRAKDEKRQSWQFDTQTYLELINSAHKNPLWNEWNEIEASAHIKKFLIYGENSMHLDENSKKILFKQMPLTKKIEVHGAGHLVHAEKAQEFTNIILKEISI